METTKWRKLPAKDNRHPQGGSIVYSSGVSGPYGSAHGVYTDAHINECQYIVSEGHPFRLLGRTAKLDIGGRFESKKIQIDLGEGCEWWTAKGRFVGQEWSFYLVPSTSVGSALWDLQKGQNGRPGDPTDTETKAKALLSQWCPPLEGVSNINQWGTSVISSVAPTNPVADVAVSIGELISERKFFALPGASGSLPGEYLNIMFGVTPTLSLVGDLRTAIEDQDKILKQLHRDSGRLVRRQFAPDPEITSQTEKFANVYPGAIYTGLPNLGTGELTLTTRTTKTWKFDGAFTYYLPKSGWERDLAELDHLYGVRPGLSLAWELLPYSWLADYFANMGDVIQNLDNFSQDGLVMPYAYVSRKQETVYEYRWVGSLLGKNWPTMVPKVLEAKIVATTMQRERATPFGFGITDEMLSLKQLSILAALGLSKA